MVNAENKLRRFLNQRIRIIKNKIRAHTEVNRWDMHSSQSPVLIYQMGKVGSRSIYDSLLSADISDPIFFVHYLSNDVFLYKKRHIQAGIKPIPYHIELGMALRKKIKKNAGKTHFRIITVIRDPIAREISSFFQNLSFYKKRVTGLDGKIIPDECISLLMEKFNNPDNLDYKSIWFDREIRTVFGIDLFEFSFDPGLGWSVIKTAIADILILRVEDLDRIGSEIIPKFLHLDSELQFNKSNVRSEMADAEIYEKVRRSLKLEPSRCKAIYELPFVRHFYDESEIESFIKRWSK